MKHSRKLVLTVVAAVSLIGAACSKKHAALAPPPPPEPAPQAITAVSKPAVALPHNLQSAAVTPAPVKIPQYPNAATRTRIDQLLAKIEDAYFDYDKANIRPDALQALQADSAELRDILKDYPTYRLTIEGHCDERGSAEYNLGLGDRRAAAAKDYLVAVGIPARQLATVSYGKERPACTEHNEDCWQKNRRVHILAQATPPHP